MPSRTLSICCLTGSGSTKGAAGGSVLGTCLLPRTRRGSAGSWLSSAIWHTPRAHARQRDPCWDRSAHNALPRQLPGPVVTNIPHSAIRNSSPWCCLRQPPIPVIVEPPIPQNSAAFAWSRRSWDPLFGKRLGQPRCRRCPYCRTEETAAVLWDGHSYLVTNVRPRNEFSDFAEKASDFVLSCLPNNGVPTTWARGGRWYGQAQAGRRSAPPLRGAHGPQTSPPRTTRLSKRSRPCPRQGWLGLG